MNAWYELTDMLLPFQWASHSFMKNALLAILMVTPVLGMLGTMVVSKNMAFFSDSIGHSALTGVAVGVILGISDPSWAMIVFSVVLSVLISYVRNRSGASTDTTIGVFSSTVVALGIAILSRGGNFVKYSYYLVGDLLSITPRELNLLGFAFLFVVVFWIFIYNRLLVISLNRSIAKSRRFKTGIIETAFMVVVAVIVTIAVRWVGILIINSLLVLPAAAARNISSDARAYHAASVSIAMASGISGLIFSYYWGTATGATIVLVCSAFFAVTFLVKTCIKK